jgi:hypothetical protein
MKTVSLRTLVREPLKVKQMTRAGESVQVTDNGRPLWILQPADGTEAEQVKRQTAIDEVLDELLSAKRSGLSLSKIVMESRR